MEVWKGQAGEVGARVGAADRVLAQYGALLWQKSETRSKMIVGFWFPTRDAHQMGYAYDPMSIFRVICNSVPMCG